MTMHTEITLQVNERLHRIEVGPADLLIDVLRDRLGLTGAKKGCGTGDCGACTVMLANRPVTACLVLAAAADGKPIETIESLSQDGQLHPLQQKFLEYAAVQCGYCIPGILMMGKAILDANPDAGSDAIRLGLSGNLCRCTGYSRIVKAVLAAEEAIAGRD